MRVHHARRDAVVGAAVVGVRVCVVTAMRVGVRAARVRVAAAAEKISEIVVGAVELLTLLLLLAEMRDALAGLLLGGEGHRRLASCPGAGRPGRGRRLLTLLLAPRRPPRLRRPRSRRGTKLRARGCVSPRLPPRSMRRS
jgi:hypothetical protein